MDTVSRVANAYMKKATDPALDEGWVSGQQEQLVDLSDFGASVAQTGVAADGNLNALAFIVEDADLILKHESMGRLGVGTPVRLWATLDMGDLSPELVWTDSFEGVVASTVFVPSKNQLQVRLKTPGAVVKMTDEERQIWQELA